MRLAALVIVCGLIGGAAATTVTSDVQGSDADPVAEVYKGFHLSSGDCAGRDADCGLRQPKQWTREEAGVIARAVDGVLTRSDGRVVIRLAQGRGARDLRRYSIGVVASEPQAGIVAQSDRGRSGAATDGIDIYDRFFAEGTARDLYSGHPGYLLVAERLLHECFHAVDNWSAQPAFRAAIGFVRAGSRPRFSVDNVGDVAALTTWDSDLPKLEAEHDYAAVSRLNRSVALRMRPVRVPSMESIRSPAEAFAELGAHLVLDPRARTYLARPAVEYFDTHVLPELRRLDEAKHGRAASER